MKKIALNTLCFLLYSQFLFAGLVIEIDPNISAIKIDQISIDEYGNLFVEYTGGNQLIELREGVLHSILLWVNQNANGPFVFSYDSAIVPGAGKYASASLPKGLSEAMFSYDVFAHSLARGATSEEGHPLISLNGNSNQMPDKQYQELMNLSNNESNALRYRNAMFRHLERPGCVGEFTIRALPSNNGFPVKIEVESFRTLRSVKWYRPTDVFTPQDREIFSLPYLPLKKDIENRWNEYRALFPPLDELSNIVEAYAILNVVQRTDIKKWQKFIKQNIKENDKDKAIPYVEFSDTPGLSTYDQSWDIDYSWLTRCEQIIWDSQLDEIAIYNNEISAKLQLLKLNNELYNDEGTELKKLVDTFFKLTKKSKELFQIRLRGIRYLKEQFTYQDIDSVWFEDRYNQELKLFLNDFIELVNKECEKDASAESSEIDINKWENLSQYIYSTGLLEMVDDHYGYRLASDFSAAVACIHFNRGRVFQKGRKIAYRHAHFRFLKYLLENSWEEELLTELIQGYRIQLARIMGITEWEEDKERFNYEENYNDISDDFIERIQDNWYESFSLEQGKILAAASFVSKSNNLEYSYSSLEKGKPGGILNNENQFTLLLINGELLSILLSKQDYKSPLVKIFGISYDNGKCLKPVRIEYFHNGEWRVFDFSNPMILN